MVNPLRRKVDWRTILQILLATLAGYLGGNVDPSTVQKTVLPQLYQL